MPKITVAQLAFLGEDFIENYNEAQFSVESSLLIYFKDSGTKNIRVEFSNPVSQETAKFQIRLLAVVNDLKFVGMEPPVANRTTQITLAVGQVRKSRFPSH